MLLYFTSIERAIIQECFIIQFHGANRYTEKQSSGKLNFFLCLVIKKISYQQASRAMHSKKLY